MMKKIVGSLMVAALGGVSLLISSHYSWVIDNSAPNIGWDIAIYMITLGLGVLLIGIAVGFLSGSLMINYIDSIWKRD